MPARPKREAELSRDRSRKGGDQKTTFKLQLQPVTVPNIPKHWHPIARRLFKSLETSGQSDRFQDSDWAFAYTICDDISRYKRDEDRVSDALDRLEHWEKLTPDEREAEGLSKTAPPRVPKGGSAMKLSALMDALARLGYTEGDRLKVRIELVEPHPEEDSAAVVAINDYRAKLGVAE